MADGCISHTVTVSSGDTASTGVATGGKPLVGIVLPSALTSSSLSLYASTDGTTYYPIYDNLGVACDAQVAASRWVATYWPDLFVPYIRLEMASAEGAERSIMLILAEV